jgi:hypothetical protein
LYRGVSISDELVGVFHGIIEASPVAGFAQPQR